MRSWHFSGFELIDPGLVHPRNWRPDTPHVIDPEAAPGELDMWGGVGLLPR
jgi:S-adenosyl methyltransferase